MNLEHYKNFVTIVDTGTISGAAEKLLIAQPALSNQIKGLEEYYGAKLIVRYPRRIELTDAGKILYEKIKSICYLEDSARKGIKACVEGNSGTLWLGVTPAYPDPVLYQILLDYHQKYPQVSFEVFERNSQQIMELLETGIIEVGLIRSQVYIPYTLRPILTLQEQMMAYYHREHITLSPDLKKVPLASLKELPISISNGLKKGFASACLSLDFQPEYMNISASRFISQLWAADKKTVAIIVAPAPYDEDSYCCREILAENLYTQRCFAIEKKRKLSAIAENFLQFCRQHPLVQHWASDKNDF